MGNHMDAPKNLGKPPSTIYSAMVAPKDCPSAEDGEGTWNHLSDPGLGGAQLGRDQHWHGSHVHQGEQLWQLWGHRHRVALTVAA